MALAVLFTALSGAGFGAIYGAYYDDPGEAAATGAVVGAGVGLIGGPLFLMSKTRRDSKIRVESCARKRGYDVVGWR